MSGVQYTRHLTPRKVSDADRLFGTLPEIYKNKMPTASVFRNRTVFFFLPNIITGRYDDRQFFLVFIRVLRRAVITESINFYRIIIFGFLTRQS